MNPSEMPDDPLSIIEMADQITAHEEAEFKKLLTEKIRRDCEALRIYEPMPHQEALHKSRIRKLVMQKGNRVGGSLACAVEVARAVTGQDPHKKYPERDGIAVCLGYGEGHIGRVFHRLLFRPGAFYMIRDLETGKWRAYRPWPQAKGGDFERDAEKKPAPPLIPPRFIDGDIVWVKKGARIFELVRFTTGWELHALNSAGDSSQAQGFNCHLAWVDEDTAERGWIEEIIGRQVETAGLFRWTALPHGKNDEMMNLIDDAEKQAESEHPTTVVVRSTIFDNRYLSDRTREESVEAWRKMGEDVYRKRALGEISIGSVLMYPTFNRRLHDVMNTAIAPSRAQKILQDRNGEPPEDWTRYAIVDPGSTVCAVEFATRPPEELGDQLFLYDECYIRNATAEQFGDAMAWKCRDHVFEAFVIDIHGGRLRGIASGDVPVEKYSDALKSREIRSEQTGYGFRNGCDQRKLREDELRTQLSVTRDGHPQFMVVVARCPMFCWEMERFKKKTVRQGGKDIPIDEGDRRANTHAIEAGEMAVASNLSYVKPRDKAIKESWVDIVLREEEHNKQRRRARLRSFGGSNISLSPLGESR